MTRSKRIATLLVLGTACLVAGYFILSQSAALSETVAPPAPLQLTTVDVSKVSASEIGFTRSAAQITVPANHKLTVFYRVYLDGKFDAKLSRAMEYMTITQRTEQIGTGVFDPDVLSPVPSNKIKILYCGLLPGDWIEVKKKSCKTMDGGCPKEPIKLGETVHLFRLEVGESPTNPSSETLRGWVWDLRVRVAVLVELLNEKELSTMKKVNSKGGTTLISQKPIEEDLPSGGR